MIGFAVCAPKLDKINSNCDTLAPRFPRIRPRSTAAKTLLKAPSDRYIPAND